MAAPLVAFVIAAAFALLKGEKALRGLFVVIVISAPLRGGLLAIADSVGLSDPGLAVNALVPALVAAFALGVLAVCRPSLDRFPKSLTAIWLLVAIVALLNLPFQMVGLKLYAIGLAQYLVYPTLALAGWFLMRPGDIIRVTYLFLWVGTAVALTVLIQAAGIESFIQAATAQVDGFAADRYAGITGSYLHTSAFLGVCAVLGLGIFLRAESGRQHLAIGVAIAFIFSGVILTFSRSGIMISLIGIALLLIFAATGQRLRAVSMLLVAGMVALAIGAWGGVTPDEAGTRTSSGLNPTGDAGNQQRLEGIQGGLEEAGSLAFMNRVFGEGLAYTGNARQLTDGEILAVESYLVKLLVETGVLGLLAIGGVLIWALYVFARSVLRVSSPVVASIGAAGVGLSLYNLIYPALETQLLALTWWSLLLLIVFNSSSSGAEPEDGVDTG